MRSKQRKTNFLNNQPFSARSYALDLCFGAKVNPSGTFPSNISDMRICNKTTQILHPDRTGITKSNTNTLKSIFTQSAAESEAIRVSRSFRPK